MTNGSLIGKGGITVGTGDDLTKQFENHRSNNLETSVDIKCTGDLIMKCMIILLPA